MTKMLSKTLKHGDFDLSGSSATETVSCITEGELRLFHLERV